MTIAAVIKKCIAKQAERREEEVTLEHTLGAFHLDGPKMAKVAESIENELGLLWPDSNLAHGLETSPGMTVQGYIDAVQHYIDAVPGLRENINRKLEASE
jgi:hypothetical protein